MGMMLKATQLKGAWVNIDTVVVSSSSPKGLKGLTVRNPSAFRPAWGGCQNESRLVFLR